MSAELAIGRGADGSASRGRAAASRRTARFFQSEELLGTEGLVMDLAGGFNQVLKVSTSKEVAQVDKFAVMFIFDINDTPAGLPAANLLATDDDGLFAANDGEGNDVLDLSVDGAFFVIKLVVVVWVHFKVVEREFFLDPFFECSSFLQSQRVCLCDHRNHIDHI